MSHTCTSSRICTNITIKKKQKLFFQCSHDLKLFLSIIQSALKFREESKTLYLREEIGL